MRAFRPWVLNQPGRILTAYAIYTPSDGSSHAFAYWLTGREFNRATISPDGKGLGELAPNYKQKRGWINLDAGIRSLSGPAAERIYLGNDTRRDILVDYEGWASTYSAHSRFCDEEGEGCVEHFCDRLVATLADFTEELMRLQWPIIKRIAEALLNQKALTYRQVHDIILDTVLTTEPYRGTRPELENLRNWVEQELPDDWVGDLLWVYRPAKTVWILSQMNEQSQE